MAAGASLHTDQQHADNRGHIQSHQGRAWCEVLNSFTHWVDQQLTSLEHAADQHNVEFQSLEIQLANHRFGQLAKFATGPLNQLAGNWVTCFRNLKNEWCGISIDLMAISRVTFQEINITFGTTCSTNA